MGGGANHWEVIEWIPYDRFKDVKQIGKGEFGTIHYAMWIDGKLENGILKNDNGEEIFDNFVNFNDVLNEMAINLKARTELASIKFYGITQDPETLSYMMVLNYAKDGNHREYLKINFNNINWFQKSYNLWHLSYSKLIGENPNNPEKKNIFGVLPYIAPEVLITGFPPYHDIPHGQDLAMKICNGL
ncbi:hypothetical protein Glove_177g18 [Diversispora epigaea]|nr:hypothetical protein Glove_177g18 [Diversispora epigaea]